VTDGLDGRVAVVTGASSGIGLAAARRLHSDGARVVISARDPHRLREAAASIADDVVPIPADVTDKADLDRLMATVGKELGQIDILFINAGLKRFAHLADATEELFDEVSPPTRRVPTSPFTPHYRTSTTVPRSSCAVWPPSNPPGAAPEPASTRRPKPLCSRSPVPRRANSHTGRSG
jgi:hypothetical protein